MLSARLRLPPKKWAEYLNDMWCRFHRTLENYRIMQAAIVLERPLEKQVGMLHTDRAQGHANPGMYLTSNSDSNLMPLYLCLGTPTAIDHAASVGSFWSSGGQ